MTTQVRLTLAQYRMLGRIIRGERLRISHFRLETATVASLNRKRCITLDPAWATDANANAWDASDLGRRAHAARGFLKQEAT